MNSPRSSAEWPSATGHWSIPLRGPNIDDHDGSTTTTVLPTPSVVVGFFPKLKVASLGELSANDPIKFEHPLRGQHNILVKLDTPVATGVGPDDDIAAFSSLCTQMGCLVENYQPGYREKISDTPGQATPDWKFKLGKGRLKKIGTTDLVGRMSFIP